LTFNSIEFLAFFAVVTMVCHALPGRHRWWWLLGASYCFYATLNLNYAVLIATVTLISYGTALFLQRVRTERRRSACLWCGIGISLGILFTFKYFDFFGRSLVAVGAALGSEVAVPHLNLLLPVGISFYTFQSVGYVIDVYRGKCPPEGHVGRYGLFVSFFPHVLAGPIARAPDLLPQFRGQFRFDYDRARDGLVLMLWGFFKKIVVADRAGLIVDRVYGDPANYHGAVLLIAACLYSFQILCDFSAYTDVARGAARVLGIDLMQNFKRPYGAESVAEFWRRWHISLTSWLRDYLYIPLGGNRCGKAKWVRNIAIVFLLSGLWHGAGWTYVVWGALHASFLIISRYTATVRDAIADGLRVSRCPLVRRSIRVAITFGLVTIAWVFFRAASVHEAYLVLSGSLFGTIDVVVHAADPAYLMSIVGQVGISAMDGNILLLGILFSEVGEMLRFSDLGNRVIRRAPSWVRLTACHAVAAAILFYGAFNTGQQFVYFQF
jgi:D-alanyl-lipoteichoic acid acyltransferase DltB (MBOAT superfamily)